MIEIELTLARCLFELIETMSQKSQEDSISICSESELNDLNCKEDGLSQQSLLRSKLHLPLENLNCSTTSSLEPATPQSSPIKRKRRKIQTTYVCKTKTIDAFYSMTATLLDLTKTINLTHWVTLLEGADLDYLDQKEELDLLEIKYTILQSFVKNQRTLITSWLTMKNYLHDAGNRISSDQYVSTTALENVNYFMNNYLTPFLIKLSIPDYELLGTIPTNQAERISLMKEIRDGILPGTVEGTYISSTNAPSIEDNAGALFSKASPDNIFNMLKGAKPQANSPDTICSVTSCISAKKGGISQVRLYIYTIDSSSFINYVLYLARYLL